MTIITRAQIKNNQTKKAFGYLAASVIALAGDMVITLAVGCWLAPHIAAAIGFMAGTVISYFLAKTWAFTGIKTLTEFFNYAFVGVVTLIQTSSMVYYLSTLRGWPLFYAKCTAIPISFVIGFMARSALTSRSQISNERA